MTDLGNSEVLPDSEPIRPGAGSSFRDWLPPAKMWDIAGIGAAVIVGALPVLAELFFRGSDRDGHEQLFNPSSIGYSFFAIGAAAAVQCAQNSASRAWICATLPSILCGLILGLNYSDPLNSPDGIGWSLVACAGVFTLLAVFVGWRPATHE
jgi:peptidoglycan/LPS O-acetylase OafA/YrhL